jgi:NAD-dependent SIR2 family protein deacetylase
MKGKKGFQKRNLHHNWTDTPSVLTLHKRIHRRHGSAKNYKCTECDNQAKDWSLNGNTYTDKIEDYAPRCRSCHIRKDDKLNDRGLKISIGLKRAYREGRR